MYEYHGKVIRVIDGDTIVVIIDLGFDISLEQTVRLARIDAYEKTLRSGQSEEEKQIGIQATRYLTELIDGKEVILKTYKESGKYGRYIADVIYEQNNLNDEMVKLGYAKYVNY